MHSTNTRWFIPAVHRSLAVVGLVLLLSVSAVGSDHADPIFNREQEGGITDLFAFPAKDGIRMMPEKDKDGKQIRDAGQNIEYRFTPGAPDWRSDASQANELVVIFNVRRSLTTSPPFGILDQFTYEIHFDFHSQLDFEKDLANLARYGGTVVTPEGIAPDATIKYVLNNDTSIKSLEFTGFQNTARIPRPYVGVRDDPFIFPMFFGTNVIAFVVRIPFSCLPSQGDFVLWATSARHGKQVDHVGRSQRTQLPRFDLLNTLPPREHVAALHESTDNPGLTDEVLRNIISPPFSLRPYDYQPDVMFYSRDRKPRYPNGRQLEDDVAFLTCLQGDCQLFELSQSHPKFSKGPAGRPTMNDKEFTNTFPYLAEPQPDSDPPAPARGPIAPSFTNRNWAILGLIALFVLLLLLFPWVLYFRALRRLRRTAQQLTVLQKPPSSPAIPPASPTAPPQPTS